MRRHVRYIDSEPAIISDDYFDERIVRGTELAKPEDTTRENILAEAGYEQVYDIDEIIIRMPTPSEVDRLMISTGTPVAEHIRTGYTADGRADPSRGFPRSWNKAFSWPAARVRAVVVVGLRVTMQDGEDDARDDQPYEHDHEQLGDHLAAPLGGQLRLVHDRMPATHAAPTR